MFFKIFQFQEKLRKVPGFKPALVNCSIKKENAKVVDTVDIEDMGDKVIFKLFERFSKIEA